MTETPPNDECDFAPATAGRTCRYCGYVYRGKATGRLRRKCPALLGSFRMIETGVGLGDHVAMMFDAAGVTPKRVTWWLSAMRLISADASCGCDERRRRLNEIGRKLVKWCRRRSTSS